MAELLERLKKALEERYEIEREIGHGGSATVYLATDHKLRRRVALKVLDPQIAMVVGPERFLREIETTASLNHPHVLPLLDSGETDGLLFYTMPYVEGETLRDLLDREKQLSLEDSIRLTTEVASALDYAHRNGLIHRDIKPENILLVDGRAVVADFGIAKALDAAGGDALTQTGIAVGTPAYMSPEQVSGSGDMDARSDLYSLGCVLYEMLAGHPPFVGSSRESVMRQHLLASPTEITAIRGAIPGQVEQSLSRVLSKTPADRYTTPSQFVEALSKPPEAGVGLGARGPSRYSLASAWRSKGIRWAVGALAIAILAIGAWKVYEASREAPPPPVSASKVAVFPFSVRGGEEDQVLGESAALLLARALDGAGDLQVADSRTLLDYSNREFSDSPDPAQARTASERFGAGVYVLGDVTVTGDRMRIDATLYQNGMESQSIAATSEGAEEELTSLVDDVAQQLLADLVGSSGARLDSVAVVTTVSFPALKQYLKGESESRAGNLEAATAAFKQAVELDSTFALAWARLSELYGWTWNYPAAVECADRAKQYSDRLSYRDRAHLDAQGAFMRGDPDEAESIFRLLVLDHPDDARAWRYLAETLFTYNCFRGRSVLEAREPYYKSLELKPEDADSRSALIRLELLAENFTVADSLIEVLKITSGSPLPGFFEMNRIYASRDQTQIARVESLLARGNLLIRWAAAFFIYQADPISGRGMLRDLTGDTYSPAERAGAHSTLALLHLERGQWKAAQEELRAAERLDLVIGSAYRALLSCTTFLSVQTTELDELVETIEQWRRVSGERGNASSHLFFRRLEGNPELIQTYLLGHLNILRGNQGGALENVARLESWNGSAGDNKWAQLYAQSIRAVDAWKQDQSEKALSILENMPIISQPAGRLGFKSEANERSLRAELLFGLGRYADARGWYEGMNQVLLFDSSYRGPSYLRLGEIAERLGEPEAAVNYYSRFIELWKDCDPELRPMVEDARRRMEVLLGEPSAS